MAEWLQTHVVLMRSVLTQTDLRRSSGCVLLTLGWLLFAPPAYSDLHLSSAITSSTPSQTLPVVRIGVHAFRSLAQTDARWQPTADYLNRTLPAYTFELLPLAYPELNQAVADKTVEFVLTHPDDYIQLHHEAGIEAVATLITRVGDHPLAQFGGVIFSRSDRDDINRLDDLRGKSLVSARNDVLGGYIAQQWTLKQAGIDSQQDLGVQRFIGLPQDNSVYEVLKRSADIGFVRTGILETMAREGKIDLSLIKVINQQPRAAFPLLLSTDLYPEWPLAALAHVDTRLKQSVSSQLQRIAASDPAARVGQYIGFSPALDYSPVEAVMLRLNTHSSSKALVFDRLTGMLLKWGAVLLGLLLIIGTVVLRRSRKHNRALRRINIRLRQHQAMLDRLGEGVYCMDAQGYTQFINPAAVSLLGYSRDEIATKKSHALFHHSHEDGSPYPIEACPTFQTLVDGVSRQVEDWFVRKDGTLFPVELRANAIVDADRVQSVVVAFSDITERKALLNELRQQRVLLQSVIDATTDLIFFKDPDGFYLGANQAFQRLVGKQLPELQGKTDFELFNSVNARLLRAVDMQVLQQNKPTKNEEWASYPNGDRVLLETLKTPVIDSDGLLLGLVGVSRDITERKQAEEDAEQLAFYDPLTQLPNRRLLLDRIEHSLAESVRSGSYGALLMIDLDNFKPINDNEGHEAGDRVLCEVASRLIKSVRETDTVGRLGGDEFMVVLDFLGDRVEIAKAHAGQIATSILQQLQEPHLINGSQYVATSSIGIALFVSRHESIKQLFKEADAAMYQAKAAGRNRYQVSSGRVDECNTQG